MNKAVPWSIKGVDFDAREAAKEAARRDGLTLGEWMNRVLSDRAAEIGVTAQEFDMDDRLEAVAAQLARLSREADGDSTPHRRRGDATRRAVLRQETRQDARQGTRQETRNDRAPFAEARRGEPDLDDDVSGEGDGYGRPMGPTPERPRRARTVREASDAEALLEQAVAAFQQQAGRVEAGAARAIANVANLIERTEADRQDKLARLNERLAALECQSPKSERPSGEHVSGEPFWSERPAVAAPPRRDPVRPEPRDEQFLRLERRFEALMGRLDSQDSRAAPPQPEPPQPEPPQPEPPARAPEAPRRGLDEAISAITARQRDLESTPRPVRAPPLATLIEERFEALSRKLDRTANKSFSAPEEERIDRLQQGIEGLAGRLEGLRHEFSARASGSEAPGLEKRLCDLADRVEAALSASSVAGPADLEKLRGELAAIGRSLTDVAPRGAVAGVESAIRDLANRVESARDVLLRASVARGETASSAEIEVLGRQVAAMSLALADVAPRSQMAALETAVQALGERIELSRTDGLREAVLAPIESLAGDLKRAMAESAASADLDGVVGRLHQVEAKLDDLRRAGWADRDDFQKIRVESDELRAMIGAAVERLAPIERIEKQVAALSGRLEEVARQAGEAACAQEVGLARNLAQNAAGWRGVETRLDDLASRIDRMGDAHGPVQEMKTPPSLEPLLRALAEKLDMAAAPQPDASALDALERQMKLVSAKLERGDQEWGTRLERAVEEMAKRFETSRDMAATREIADLREERNVSDMRAQKTLSAVHETLEKVVDRLAMLEDDVIETRAAQNAQASDKFAQGKFVPAGMRPFDADSFLVEPGAGPPDARAAVGEAASSREDEKDFRNKTAQANYIDVARRAIAAREAADSADKAAAERRKRAKVAAGGPVAEGDSGFVRPLAAAEKTGGRRLPSLLAMAGAVLLLGAYQAYRVFNVAPPPSIQSVVEPHGEAKQPAQLAPAATNAPKPAPSEEKAAPPAVAPALNPAPMAPGAMMTPPKPAAGVDPLAVGSIAPRANTISAVQLAALKEMATKGNAAAQYDMGARLNEGRGLARDPAAAIGWFEKAAAQGVAQAQFHLGAIFEKGVGAPRDAVKAQDYYAKAATLGHVRAMHNLAVLEAEGVDSKPDYAAAAQWFRRAADFGVRDSQYNLAILYARGMGVTQNLGQSYVWFDIAARQGDTDAAKKRDEIGARLDAASLAAAKKQAADFHARTPDTAVNDPPAVPTGPAAAAVFSPAYFSRM